MIDWNLMGILATISISAIALALYPFKNNIKAIVILVPVCALSLGLGYAKWGGYAKRESFLAGIEKKKQVAAVLKTVNGKDELILKLKQQVQRNSDSAKGWYLLGRLYASQDSWSDANECFEKAYQLKPEEISIIINVAQSKLQLNHQQFNKEIRSLFEKALRLNNQQPDALAMLAMDAFIHKDYEKAISLWQQLLQLMPTNSEDAKAVRKAIARAQEQLKHESRS